jgi:hypothetical protein
MAIFRRGGKSQLLKRRKIAAFKTAENRRFKKGEKSPLLKRREIAVVCC